ncbi:hypothetical protein BSL82_06475 [Tardibacter chloracetimidivorans]|uniref:Uncharacterized protein n=2 Tax=Tardibacter chloracetimidivorans TaxID=1921510 RepID=A0A1L3ZTP8_9SPHN|nr:hypothetical protein BSL82_06475 [Tardibacter chloracetimidivorans]
MACEMNDCLVGYSPQEQFQFVGFGMGFLQSALQRADISSRDEKCFITVHDASEDDELRIGWLNLMQKIGVDNAPASSANLSNAILAAARHMQKDGPYMMKFWDKFHSKEAESVTKSGTSPENLEALVELMGQLEERGRQLALGARIS